MVGRVRGGSTQRGEDDERHEGNGSNREEDADTGGRPIRRAEALEVAAYRQMQTTTTGRCMPNP